MKTQLSFDIILRRPIRVLTKSTSIGIGLAIGLLAMLWVLMLPATGSLSSQEMKVAYFISAVPGWLVYLSAMAAVALMVLIPLHLIRRRLPALLTFCHDEIQIASKRGVLILPFAKISGLWISDLKDSSGFPRGIFQVAIESGKGRFEKSERSVFTLHNYEDGGALLDQLSELNISVRYMDSTTHILLDE
jgi:hypothetical protein